MATIEQNLQSLVTAKNNIATAITDKGVILPEGAGFLNFPDGIASIQTGSPMYTGEVTSMTGNAHFGSSYKNRMFMIGKLVVIKLYVYHSASSQETITIKVKFDNLSASDKIDYIINSGEGSWDYYSSSNLGNGDAGLTLENGEVVLKWWTPSGSAWRYLCSVFLLA